MVSNLGEVGEVRKPGILLDLWGVLCSWNSGWGCEERWEKNLERRCVYSITSAHFSPSEPCLAGEAGHWPLCSSDSVAARVLFRKQVCQSNGLGNMTRHSAWLWRHWFRGQFLLASSVQLCGCREVVVFQMASWPLNQLGDGSWNQQTFLGGSGFLTFLMVSEEVLAS